MGKKTKLEVRALKTVTSTTSQTSAIMDISGVDTVCVQYVWSGGVGTPVGAFTYEVSNDGVNFVSYAHAPVATQSGDSGTFFGMIANLSTNTFALVAAKYLRVKHTLSSGTSVVVDAYVFGKSHSS